MALQTACRKSRQRKPGLRVVVFLPLLRRWYTNQRDSPSPSSSVFLTSPGVLALYRSGVFVRR